MVRGFYPVSARLQRERSSDVREFAVRPAGSVPIPSSIDQRLRSDAQPGESDGKLDDSNAPPGTGRVMPCADIRYRGATRSRVCRVKRMALTNDGSRFDPTIPHEFKAPHIRVDAIRTFFGGD